MKDLLDACKEYFADSDRPEEFGEVIQSVEVLEEHSEFEINVRVRFGDETVSDWKLTRDEEDGTVLDAYCFNEL